jgi:hypothetical protein
MRVAASHVVRERSSGGGRAVGGPGGCTEAERGGVQGQFQRRLVATIVTAIVELDVPAHALVFTSR